MRFLCVCVCLSDYEVNCRPAHGFIHVLPITHNMTEFTRVVQEQRISGNMDTPEGGFDAMLQATVCQVNTPEQHTLISWGVARVLFCSCILQFGWLACTGWFWACVFSKLTGCFLWLLWSSGWLLGSYYMLKSNEVTIMSDYSKCYSLFIYLFMYFSY